MSAVMRRMSTQALDLALAQGEVDADWVRQRMRQDVKILDLVKNRQLQSCSLKSLPSASSSFPVSKGSSKEDAALVVARQTRWDEEQARRRRKSAKVARILKALPAAPEAAKYYGTNGPRLISLLPPRPKTAPSALGGLPSLTLGPNEEQAEDARAHITLAAFSNSLASMRSHPGRLEESSEEDCSSDDGRASSRAVLMRHNEQQLKHAPSQKKKPPPRRVSAWASSGSSKGSSATGVGAAIAVVRERREKKLAELEKLRLARFVAKDARRSNRIWLRSMMKNIALANFAAPLERRLATLRLAQRRLAAQIRISRWWQRCLKRRRILLLADLVSSGKHGTPLAVVLFLRIHKKRRARRRIRWFVLEADRSIRLRFACMHLTKATRLIQRVYRDYSMCTAARLTALRKMWDLGLLRFAISLHGDTPPVEEEEQEEEESEEEEEEEEDSYVEESPRRVPSASGHNRRVVGRTHWEDQRTAAKAKAKAVRAAMDDGLKEERWDTIQLRMDQLRTRLIIHDHVRLPAPPEGNGAIVKKQQQRPAMAAGYSVKQQQEQQEQQRHQEQRSLPSVRAALRRLLVEFATPAERDAILVATLALLRREHSTKWSSSIKRRAYQTRPRNYTISEVKTLLRVDDQNAEPRTLPRLISDQGIIQWPIMAFFLTDPREASEKTKKGNAKKRTLPTTLADRVYATILDRRSTQKTEDQPALSDYLPGPASRENKHDRASIVLRPRRQSFCKLKTY